jgi:hypothetical protein
MIARLVLLATLVGLLATLGGCGGRHGGTRSQNLSPDGTWPVDHMMLQPAEITVHSGTTFDCNDVKCRLLGVKESSDPEKGKQAIVFARKWFEAPGKHIQFDNSGSPLTEDGVCVVWVRGLGKVLALNTDLVAAGLVDIVPDECEDYSFLRITKSGPVAPYDWRGELRKTKQDFDDGKPPPIVFDWWPETSKGKK